MYVYVCCAWISGWCHKWECTNHVFAVFLEIHIWGGREIVQRNGLFLREIRLIFPQTYPSRDLNGNVYY
jgi:hypothetical protein